MRIVWLSDIHLNFVEEIHFLDFVKSINDLSPDMVLIGGDIGEADSVFNYLHKLRDLLQADIYFVLGNHDYYRGSIGGVREAARDISRSSKRLTWLFEAGVIEITPSVAVIGHDGWSDGRFGDYWQSDYLLNDYFLIKEFRALIEEATPNNPGRNEDATGTILASDPDVKRKRFALLNKLGDESADYIQAILQNALETYQEVILLTHVPPFKQICLYQGKISDENGLPHFSCKSMGDELEQLMGKYSKTSLTVLCGHTHDGGHAIISHNIETFSAKAIYGAPEIAKILTFD